MGLLAAWPVQVKMVRSQSMRFWGEAGEPMPSGWIDTETKALLGAAPPNKVVATGLAGFSLILLDRGSNSAVLTRALLRIQPWNPSLMSSVTSSECPITIATGLSEADAVLGQFEIVCAEAISAFVRDEVVSEGDPHYLDRLYASIRQSPEFTQVIIRLFHVPDSEDGRSFLQQFLGDETSAWHTPLLLKTLAKKARIMRHWGEKLGCTIVVENVAAKP
jgi:hypothetical protein